jgi:hypothetical protein
MSSYNPSEATCKVCGQPLAAHELRFHNGVAGTRCSYSEADRQYFVGEINRLMTIRRSLRWRGGRDSALWEYSNFVERERLRLLKLLARYFPWAT